jgi:hypothetical protein
VPQAIIPIDCKRGRIILALTKAPSAMSYEWDVFLSYLREPPSGSWVNDHFLPHFRWTLGNALNKKARVFYDRTNIHPGQKWPKMLRQALSRSRCLVGIWSPLYFQSDWCLNECAVMLHREKNLGYGTNNNPDGLVIGVKVDDGDHFPPYASESQYADFETFFLDGPAFRQSPLFLDFQPAVRALANEVARIANNVPAWSPDWETDPWLENVIQQVRTPVRPPVTQPLIG